MRSTVSSAQKGRQQEIGLSIDIFGEGRGYKQRGSEGIWALQIPAACRESNPPPRNWGKKGEPGEAPLGRRREGVFWGVEGNHLFRLPFLQTKDSVDAMFYGCPSCKPHGRREKQENVIKD